MGRPKKEVKKKSFSACMHIVEHEAIVQKHGTLTEYVNKTIQSDIPLQKLIKRIKDKK